MNTPVPLLPHPSLSRAAALLDQPERREQLVLALDTYEYLNGPKYRGWKPAEMWRGCEGALLFWMGELARQMPYDAPLARRWQGWWQRAYAMGLMAVGPLPWWLGDQWFHLACQSQLIAQDPTTYAPQFVRAPLELAYRWPLEEENTWQLAL